MLTLATSAWRAVGDGPLQSPTPPLQSTHCGRLRKAQRPSNQSRRGCELHRSQGDVALVSRRHGVATDRAPDTAYIIKGVPGRLLFHFLTIAAETGRQDFTNREIRLDGTLRLPELKDNLETRLILLRRRLDERGAPVRLSRPGRGRIRLDLVARPVLEVVS